MPLYYKMQHLEDRISHPESLVILDKLILYGCDILLLQHRCNHIDQQNNLYVHAGYDYQNGSIKASQEIDLEFIYSTIWDRGFWKTADTLEIDSYNNVFIGHTWSKENPKLRGKVWNLDSGAGFHERLTIMDIHSKEYWKSSRAPSLYLDFENR